MHGVGNHIFDILRGYFDEHGYWTLFIALLLENAGIPVPGETVLLFASFLAFSQQQLKLPEIILIGIIAATLGDNLGYMLGRRGGRPLLDRYLYLFRLSKELIRKGEALFERHGNVTVFFARFVFGMRVLAGPLAGVLKMPWLKFVVFNFLGAATWVTVIACAGYVFGEHWDELIKTLGRVNLVIGIIAAYVGLLGWRRYKSGRKQLENKARAEAETERHETTSSRSR